MAGFEKGKDYNWKIIGFDNTYCEFKGEPLRAFRKFREFKKMCPTGKMYCNDRLVAGK